MKRQTANALQPAPQPKRSVAPRPAHPLIRLQQALGNQAVGRLVQAKLNISQPGDEYEQEADRIADTVMRMPAPQSDGNRLAITPLTSHQAQLVQRATNETATEQDETCDKEQWQVVSRAARHGKQALRYAIGELSPLRQETARATFKQYFGPDTDTAVVSVKGTLEAIEVLLAERQNRSEGRFRCALDGSEECPESRIASTDSKDKVTFCPNFFATDRTDGDRASTLIHEGAHSALGTSNVDIYDDQPIFHMLSGVAGQSGEVGEVARRNPDSLAQFVLALFGEKKPAFMPEQPTLPTYSWQGFGAETGPAEQQTINEAITWLRQWLYWAVYDLQSFKDGDASRGQIELERIGRLVKQFGLEGHLERSLTTMQSLEDKLEGGLEILRVANGAGDGGILWHEKREELMEAIKAKDPNRATEIRQQHKSDWVEVSDGFFSLGSTSERVNGLLDALSSQFETFRLVEYVRRNAANHLDTDRIGLE